MNIVENIVSCHIDGFVEMVARDASFFPILAAANKLWPVNPNFLGLVALFEHPVVSLHYIIKTNGGKIVLQDLLENDFAGAESKELECI